MSRMLSAVAALRIMTLRKRSVSRRSLSGVRTKHEEFCNAVKAGKEAFDDRVERSLAQRATGYSHQLEKGDPRYDPRAPAPDPVAAKFLLVIAVPTSGVRVRQLISQPALVRGPHTTGGETSARPGSQSRS